MGDITEKVDIVINESGGRTVKRSLDDIADSAQRGVQPINKLNSTLDVFYGSLKAIGAVVATLKLTSLISEAAALSQRYNELGIVLGVVGRNAGLARSEVDATTESVRKQGISMIESRQIVTRMIQSQIDLSKATELARLAQDAAVIGQINSSEALDRLVFGITSAQVEVLRGIGINVSFEQSYAKLAKEIGVTQNALTEQQKLQARLNVVLGEASKISGVYEGAMANAGKQMRSTERLVEDLKVKIGGLFDQTSIFAVTAYTNALKAADSSVENFTQTGQLKAWGDSVARIAAFAADSVRSVGIVFDITGKAIGAMAAQAVAVSKFDFGTAIRIQGDFNKDFDSAVASMSKMRDLVESQIIERDLLTKATERETLSLKSNSVELGKNTEEAKKDIDARNRFIQALQTEVDSIGLNEFAIKRMEAAKLGATKAASPLIDALEAENKRLNLQSIQVNQITADLNKYKQVTESVKTDQEKFSDTVEELNRLRNLTNGAAISQETYNRALKKANDELIGVKKTGNETFDALNQYTIQAARNIQTSFANFLFDPFQDGVKGMLTSFLNAIRRMVAEVAASRIANAIGLNGLLGIGGTSASGAAASSASGGLNLLNIASSGTSIMSGIRSGFGIPTLIGRGLSMLPGSLGVFGTGMLGSAGAGAFSAVGGAGTAFIGGAGTAIGGTGMGTAAGLGSTFAAAAGPLAVAAIADVVFRMLAGNKSTGSKVIDSIPIIGSLGALFFGHGPLKFRQQSLQGDISSSGFDGDFTNVFRAKGGLFVSNKHKSVAQALSDDQQKLFDATITGFYKSAHAFAENLGFSTDLVDNYTQQIQIKSEKGKQLTEEAINEMLSGVGDSLAKNVLPGIDEFRKAGERSFDTFARLNAEFSSLVDASSLVFGKSTADAKAMISGTTLQGRTAFVDAAGGTDALTQKAAFFSQNFFTSSELLAQAQTRLDEQLKSLGLSSDLTKDQFKGLVQSFGQVGGVSEDLLQSLLNLAPAFVSVRNAQEQQSAQRLGLETQLLQLQGNTAELRRRELEALDPANRALQENIFALIDQKAAAESAAATIRTNLSTAFSNLQKSVEADRKKITDQFNIDLEKANTRIQSVNDSIGKLKSLSDALKSTTDTINPQSLNNARDQIKAAIASVSAGDSPNMDAIQQSLDTLSRQDSGSFSTLADFQRSQAQSVDLIDQLKTVTGSQLTLDERSLAALEDSRDRLQAGFDNEIARLDSILTQGQEQVDALSGISSSVLTLADAISQFNSASVAAGGQTIGVTSSGISFKDIRDYSFSHTPDEIYAAAQKYGVNRSDIVASGAFSDSQIASYLMSRGIASFDVGGFVPRTGLAMIHKNEQVLTPGQQDAITLEIKQLREDLNEALAIIAGHTGNTAKILDEVSAGGNAFLTEAA